MGRSGRLFWAALGTLAGGLIILSGIGLGDKYGFGQGYSTASHFHLPPGLIVIVGMGVTILGVAGMVAALLGGPGRRSR